MRITVKLESLGDMKIGITQRVEYVAAYSETRDCLDQHWSKLLEILEMTIIPIPNTLKNVEGWLDVMKCDAYVLTGGNDLAEAQNAKNLSLERDRTELAVLRYAQLRSTPVLGVCRGLQLINVFFGGKLGRVYGHVAKRHSVRIRFDKGAEFTFSDVNSFHDWGIPIDSLSEQLIPCAYDGDNYVEAARHRKLNWLGIMWHPEREKEFKVSDLEIFRKLFNEGFS
jgi:N5-(cytidine 5'-diphosphoramidyl)-L-glutamine hydrolase